MQFSIKSNAKPVPIRYNLPMEQYYKIDKDDFGMAGEASSSVKRTLTKLGVEPSIIKRVAIAMYEAEINAFIHGGGGEAIADIDDERIRIVVKDQGKGIENLELAMQEGWSTADEEVRKMGFGAGMGLPNIEKNTDELEIITAPGKGTEVIMTINVK